MRVYRKDDIPDRFHYKTGKFVSTLTLVAEPGWFIAEVSFLCQIIQLQHGRLHHYKKAYCILFELHLHLHILRFPI